jgi:hypothetical protein
VEASTTAATSADATVNKEEDVRILGAARTTQPKENQIRKERRRRIAKRKRKLVFCLWSSYSIQGYQGRARNADDARLPHKREGSPREDWTDAPLVGARDPRKAWKGQHEASGSCSIGAWINERIWHSPLFGADLTRLSVFSTSEIKFSHLLRCVLLLRLRNSDTEHSMNPRHHFIRLAFDVLQQIPTPSSFRDLLTHDKAE